MNGLGHLIAIIELTQNKHILKTLILKFNDFDMFVNYDIKIVMIY